MRCKIQKEQLRGTQVHPGDNIGTSGDCTLPVLGAWLHCVWTYSIQSAACWREVRWPSRNNLEMRVALPLKLKGNHGCRHIRGKDFDELTINGVFKTRTTFGSGVLIWRSRGLITRRLHRILGSQEDGSWFSSYY